MLGDNIAALRKQQNLSQQALADRLFVVRQTISKWEKNLSVPDAAALQSLADALNTTVDVLLGAPISSDASSADQIAAVLSQVNDQLAIQNRRRARIWKVVAWVLGILLALNLISLVSGLLIYSVQDVAVSETHVLETIIPAK